LNALRTLGAELARPHPAIDAFAASIGIGEAFEPAARAIQAFADIHRSLELFAETRRQLASLTAGMNAFITKDA